MSLKRLPQKKGRPLLLILLLGAIVLLMVFLAKCSHRAPDERAMQVERAKSGGDTLDIAIEISPLSFRMSGDTVVGLDYEIMNEISRLSGRPLKFHAFAPMDYAVAGLDSGYYDVIVSSLPSTESLKEKFRLTAPVYLDRQVLVQLKNSESFISQPEQLGNDTVWIAAGSPFAQRISNLSDEIGESIHVKSLSGHTAEHLIMLVAKGALPRAVVNSGLAAKMKKEFYPELDMNTPVSFTQFQCWIVADRKGVGDFMDHWLDSLKRTENYVKILSRYGISPELP